MLADLHVHSNSSDGTDTPRKIVALAASIGLGAVAICDHDTLEGTQPAVDEAQKHPHLKVLPAIELSADINGKEIHILGYMIDTLNDGFLYELSLFRHIRQERMIKMISRLNQLGIPVDRERINEIAGSGSIGRPHIARAMVEAGIVYSMEDAFNHYLGEGRPGFVPKYKCTPIKAVHLISMAKGVPVLAHPGLSDGSNCIPSLINSLKTEGLQGIEVYHPSHTPDVSQYYYQICKKHDLVATGGSDYHGMKNQNQLGSVNVSLDVVDQILDLARLNRSLNA